ncbi:MAG: hypothetical protein JWQ60_4066, partial [Pseudonocardia sp.]|nr:hypothetical protein [Pseudonocardia sp.]
GANLDAASITQPDLFTRCLADGFTEVLSLHHPHNPHLKVSE